MLNENTFLFSSKDQLPSFFMSGYVFSDADFIVGERAALIFTKETKRKIIPGLDGCYLVINKLVTGDFQVGVDYDGNKKLFYYSKDTLWAFSNSYTELLKFLRSNHISLSPDEFSLSSLKITSTLTSQMSTYESLTKDILLVPTYKNIIIGKSGLRLEKRHIELPSSLLHYSDGLSSFISLWVKRYESLLSDERISISLDLTGGRDSRVIFAFLIKAYKRLGKINAQLKIHSSISATHTADYRVAKKLVDKYNLKKHLNTESTNNKNNTTISNTDVFKTYSSLNIGIYYPIYFPSSISNHFNIQIHGAGGENHRHFYHYRTIDDFKNSINSNDSRINSWADRVVETTKSINTQYLNLSPWIAHYREFMGRIHAGRSPQYRSVITPFSGILPTKLSEYPGIANNAQLHFDCMESLVPGLMDFEYDCISKSPTENNKKHITIADISNPTSPGKIYISKTTYNNSSSNIHLPFDYLYDSYQKARTSEALLFMPKIVQLADQTLSKSIMNKKLSHAQFGKEISKVISFSFATDTFS